MKLEHVLIAAARRDGLTQDAYDDACDELAVLHAHAKRYLALRDAGCETNDNLRQQLEHCVDHMATDLAQFEPAPTPDQVDAAFDELIAAMKRVRDANN
jgi:hypothetical protein